MRCQFEYSSIFKGNGAVYPLGVGRKQGDCFIHVEKAMERIENFHIFDHVLPATLTDIADRMFLYVAFCVISMFLYVHKFNIHTCIYG